MLIHIFRDAESESTKSCVYGDVTTVSASLIFRKSIAGHQLQAIGYRPTERLSYCYCFSSV